MKALVFALVCNLDVQVAAQPYQMLHYASPMASEYVSTQPFTLVLGGTYAVDNQQAERALLLADASIDVIILKASRADGTEFPRLEDLQRGALDPDIVGFVRSTSMHSAMRETGSVQKAMQKMMLAASGASKLSIFLEAVCARAHGNRKLDYKSIISSFASSNYHGAMALGTESALSAAVDASGQAAAATHAPFARAEVPFGELGYEADPLAVRNLPVHQFPGGTNSTFHPKLSNMLSNPTYSADDPAPPIKVSSAGLPWPAPIERTSKFDVLWGLVTPEEVASVRALVSCDECTGGSFDADYDSVDWMPSHEMFLWQTDPGGSDTLGHAHSTENPKDPPEVLRKRRAARKALKAILEPVLQERIMPYLRERFPEHCGRPGHECTACSSLIKRYLPEQRRSYRMHLDMEAIVSVVVSLSDFGAEYRGGLFVAPGTNSREREVVPLSRGDAIVHQSDLQHGIELIDDGSERWSWIMWFKDSPTCVDEKLPWYQDCAQDGDAVCQYVQAQRVAHESKGVGGEEYWMLRAAQGGMSAAMNQLGMRHKGSDDVQAAEWFRKAIAAGGEAESFYELGNLVMAGATQPKPAGTDVVQATTALFMQAAGSGFLLAMYNVGVAYLFGFGGLVQNATRAREWFETCGQPEGMMIASALHRMEGRTEEADKWHQRARYSGIETVIRPQFAAARMDAPWPV